MMQMRFGILKNNIGLLVTLVALAILLLFLASTGGALNAQSPPLPGSVTDPAVDGTRSRAFGRFLSSNSGSAIPAVDQAIGTTTLEGPPHLAIDEDPTKQITYGLAGEPDNLNPLLTYRWAAREIHSLIVEGMLAVDPDGTLNPVLALDVPTVANGGVSPDGLTITYTLRNDILWSDGAAFTCDDVLFTYAAITHPDSGAVSTAGYDHIQSVVCGGDFTVTVEFDEFYPAYYTLFSSILPQHATGDPANMENWAFNMLPIGTGPFALDEWIAGEHMTLVQNERYRDYPAEPLVDALVARFIPSLEEGKSMLRSGEIDILGDLSESDIPEFQGDTSVVTHIRSSSSEERLVLNLADPTLDATDDPLNNPHWALGQNEVREAIQVGIDKQEIIDQLLHGAATAGTSELSTGWARCTISPSVHSTAEANALLTAAGWTDLDHDGVRECNGCPHATPGTPLRLKIQTTTGNQLRQDVEQMLVDMMAAISVELYIENLPPSELFGSWESGAIRKHGNFDILMYMSNEGIDPHGSMFGYFHSSQMPTYANGGQGYNYSRWIDATADAALETAGSSPDLEVRKTAYQTTCERIADGIPHIYLYDRSVVYVTRDDVQGFQLHPSSYGAWNAARWDRPEASVVLGPAGGVLNSFDGDTALEFPAGAFSETVVVTHTPSSGEPPQGYYSGIGEVFHIDAVYNSSGLPAQPAPGQTYSMTVFYTDDGLNPLLERTLALYYWDTDGWVLESSSSVDTVANSVTATPNHISLWAVWGKRTRRVYLPVVVRVWQ
jgi:peptide/nickel transport system substrate-binding protein